MSVKRYGIYLAYAPTTDLRGQGLGRHLANMLRGAESRGDVRFVLACPGWLLPELQKLFEDERVSPKTYEVISTSGIPLALRFYLVFRWLWRIRTKGKVGQSRKLRIAPWFESVGDWVNGHFFSTRNPLVVLALLPLLLMVLSWLGARALARVLRRVNGLIKMVKLALKQTGGGRWWSKVYAKVVGKLRRLDSRPQSLGFVFHLYRYLEVRESSLLIKLINRRGDIDAWYSPTAFWPEFNEINGPKLMCVPDVVLSSFPVGFALAGDDRMMPAFTRVEAAVRVADRCVTYSQDVKWNTLVKRYGANPENVHVVPHGVNSLDFLLDPANEDYGSIDAACRELLQKALCKSSSQEYTDGFANSDFDFLFYASQFRPNKNVLTLLRAYEWLLRHQYIGVKLILTGNLEAMPEIQRFIIDRGLSRDVLCLRGLSVGQLAACYRLARLAVNPSLSEGGFPFTFDEALSVGTPVVMARIGVTEEVITDAELQADMLFDPYDWKDMANKIGWGLGNRAHLYQKQKVIYDTRSKRTWAHVIDDYVHLLDEISATPVALNDLK